MPAKRPVATLCNNNPTNVSGTARVLLFCWFRNRFVEFAAGMDKIMFTCTVDGVKDRMQRWSGRVTAVLDPSDAIGGGDAEQRSVKQARNVNRFHWRMDGINMSTANERLDFRKGELNRIQPG